MGELGTITRADDSVQVTYNGMPLYYFAQDMLPGDTTGQGRGDVWWVVAP
jgi:predicted lipoprotein with Yx(FWY)xxD motif